MMKNTSNKTINKDRQVEFRGRVSANDRELVRVAFNKAVREYGKALKLLGKE